MGRAVGVVHASEALPWPLRFAPVGSVARSVGGLAVQRFVEPHFLRRVRGYSERESAAVARLSVLWFLVDSRLLAASVLARGLGGQGGQGALGPIAALGEEALLGALAPGAAATLLVRASPGGAFRAKVHAPALALVAARAPRRGLVPQPTGEPSRCVARSPAPAASRRSLRRRAGRYD